MHTGNGWATARRVTRAFTLIDLPVVLTAGTLYLFLFVSLYEARNNARVALCANSLHGVGIATMQYMVTYELDAPFVFYDGTGDDPEESSHGRPPANAPGNPAQALLPEADFERFLDSEEVFFCPTAAEKPETHYDIYGGAVAEGHVWGTYRWVYPHVAAVDDPYHPDDHTNTLVHVNPASSGLIMHDKLTGRSPHYNALSLGGAVEMVAKEPQAFGDYLYGPEYSSYE